MRASIFVLWMPLLGVPAACEDRQPHGDSNILQTMQEQALPELMDSFTEEKQAKRLRVIRTVGDIKDHRAVSLLVRAYEETREEGLRCKLLQSMGKLRDPSLLPWYVERLKDPSIGIQCFTLWALGELRTRQAIRPLRQKLWSSNRYVQMSAIDALGKTGQDPDVSVELGVFLSVDDVQMRFIAAKALGGVAGPDAVPDLMQRLAQESSIDVQEALARTLGHMGGAVAAGRFIELLKNSHSQATEHWAQVGLEAGDPVIVETMIAPLLKSDDIRVRLAASRVLIELKRRAERKSEP